MSGAVIRPWTAVMLVGTLAGCSVGPSYREPEIAVPELWSEALPASSAATGSRWWTTFRDPQLDALVERALLANLDLMAAETRVREARASRRVVAAPLLPFADANAAYSRSRTSDNIIGGGVGFNIGENDLFQAGFDAGWELDIFGGTRRAVEAADADVEASEFERADVMLVVLGEVSRNYIELRGHQRQVEVARRNLAAQRETLDLTRARAAGGLASGLDVARAESLVNTTASDIPVLESLASQATHRLGVLLGENPGALSTELASVRPIPAAAPSLPSVLPSELLRRRPDIRRAERQLAASTARVGVATADLYPKFSLVGNAGLASLTASDFFRADSATWSIGPSISWPIFRGGQIVATIEVREAQAARALLAYRGTILGALEEVENAIVSFDREKERRRALVEAVTADESAVALADELYRRGLSDFLSVLDARRTLFRSQLSLARSEASVSAYLVALHKALGGGWEGA
jgi:multidrug efflux system outer membrane protein